MTTERDARPPWLLRNWGLLLGCVLVAVGVIVLATAPREWSFGWFAYEPEADFGFVAGATPPAQGVVGAIIWALGILTITAVVAYRLGVRSSRRR